MKKNILFTLVFLLSLLWGNAVMAQDENLGTIQGHVYQDVNGDGKCVETGVEGEVPVENITIEMVSSDKQTILTFTTGPDGRYGSFATGHSYWEINVKPGSEWVITSAKTLYAPIDHDNRVATGIDFCLQKAATGTVVLLPTSGAPSLSLWVFALASIGITIITAGLFIEWQRRRV